MAQARWHLNTKDRQQFVEVPETMNGLRFLQSLRTGRADIFARQPIKSVLQMKPDDVPLGVLVTAGTGEIGAPVGLPANPATVQRVQAIHDEADHILGTEAPGRDFRVVATDNARRIRSLAKELLEILNS